MKRKFKNKLAFIPEAIMLLTNFSEDESPNLVITPKGITADRHANICYYGTCQVVNETYDLMCETLIALGYLKFGIEIFDPKSVICVILEKGEDGKPEINIRFNTVFYNGFIQEITLFGEFATEEVFNQIISNCPNTHVIER